MATVPKHIFAGVSITISAEKFFTAQTLTFSFEFDCQRHERKSCGRIVVGPAKALMGWPCRTELAGAKRKSSVASWNFVSRGGTREGIADQLKLNLQK